MIKLNFSTEMNIWKTQRTNDLKTKNNIGDKNVIHKQIRTRHLFHSCIAFQSPILQFNPHPLKKYAIEL